MHIQSIATTCRSAANILVLGFILNIPSRAVAEVKIFVPAGQIVDVWFGANVSGKLYFRIVSQDGSNEANFWWIKWGFGTVEQLGIHKGFGYFKIPIAWWRGVLSAKLRATASSSAVIYIQENSSLDAKFSSKW